jgi:hypothetical protein
MDDLRAGALHLLAVVIFYKAGIAFDWSLK